MLYPKTAVPTFVCWQNLDDHNRFSDRLYLLIGRKQPLCETHEPWFAKLSVAEAGYETNTRHLRAWIGVAPQTKCIPLYHKRFSGKKALEHGGCGIIFCHATLF